MQVSACNERAVLDQLEQHFERRLAGYKSSDASEVCIACQFISILVQCREYEEKLMRLCPVDGTTDIHLPYTGSQFNFPVMSIC